MPPRGGEGGSGSGGGWVPLGGLCGGWNVGRWWLGSQATGWTVGRLADWDHMPGRGMSKGGSPSRFPASSLL